MSERMVMKESEVNGKRYRSILQWVALPPLANHGNPQSRMDGTSDREELARHKTSFKEACWSHSNQILKEKFVADLFVEFCNFGRSRDIFCHITRSKLPVDLNARKPVVKLSYQIGGKTIASVAISMKPVTAPEGKEHELIDNSDGMGFEHRLLLPIIKQALFNSIDNECCTCLLWHIEELPNAESGKDEGSVEANARKPLEPKYGGVGGIARQPLEPKYGGVGGIVRQQLELKYEGVRGIGRQPLEPNYGDVEGIARLPFDPKVPVTTFCGNFFAKLLAEECQKAASGLISTTVASELALIGAKILAHKSGARKQIYGAGVIVGGFIGAFRAWNGDVIGAAMEVSSGIISCFPGFGEAASITLDLLLCARYAHNAAV